MKTNTTTVSVALGDRSYPIIIGGGALRRTGLLMKERGMTGTAVVITDTAVARHHLATVTASLLKERFTVHTIILPPGEAQKSLRSAERIYTELLRRSVDRSAVIIALGGGVIGDLAGFVAATYQRGVTFVQVPTTLLAQVDSSVGGKVGVNHPLAKNMVGAFHQPALVIADPVVLATLPKREMISGMGEVVKYGMILDAGFFRFVEQRLDQAFRRDHRTLAAMIAASCRMKASVVASDEKEQHLRAILNFGHTIGHALEQAGKYSALRHGEAVLYGMVAEAHIAFRNGMFPAKDQMRLELLVQRLPLPALAPLRLRRSALVAAMLKDKKTLNGEVRMPLPTRIGTVLLPSAVDRRAIDDALDYLAVYGS